jgi:hypothetical protein
VILNNSSSLKELKIPVRASIVGPVVAKPSYVEFGMIQKGASVQKNITIDSVVPLNLKLEKSLFFVKDCYNICCPQMDIFKLKKIR